MARALSPPASCRFPRRDLPDMLTLPAWRASAWNSIMNITQRYVELHPTSMGLHARAAAVFPDGVTHDMRHLTPFPLYVERAAGSRKWDVDGNEIIDYVMGHGSLLLGHNHPRVVEAVAAQLER